MNHHSNQPKPTTGEPDCIFCGRPPHPDSYGHSYRPPKPETGEWTEGKVFAYFESEDFKGLSDAHDAALDEAVDAAEQEILILRQQLAAEREKVAGLHKACRAEANHSRQLREQLAETIKASNEVADENIDLECQLAAAQAAIWRHNEEEAAVDCDAIDFKDRTALNAAIAVAQQPLIKATQEALVAIATLKITDTDKPYAEISPALRNQIVKSHDLLVSALAKVKEGK